MTAYLDRVRRLTEGRPSLRVRARSRFEPLPSDAEPAWERAAYAASPPPGAEPPMPGERRPDEAEPRAAGAARQRLVPVDPASDPPGWPAADPVPGPPGWSAEPAPDAPASPALAGPGPHRNGDPGPRPVRQTWPPRPTADATRSQDAAGQDREAAAGDAAPREDTGQVGRPEPGWRRRSADEAGDRPATVRPAGAETRTVAPPSARAEAGTGNPPPAAAEAGTGNPPPAGAEPGPGPAQPTAGRVRPGPAASSSPRSDRAAADEQDSSPPAAFPGWSPESSSDQTAPRVHAGRRGPAGSAPDSAPPDQVTVTIGRVDVRIGPPRPARSDSGASAQGNRPGTRPRPGRLEDYLRARAAGRVG
jgi:hypothetical protein